MKRWKLPLLADRFRTLWIEEDRVVMLDRRKIPKIEYVTFRDYESVAKAIEDMVIQGAPPIAYAAGYGLALAAIQNRGQPRERLKERLAQAASRLKSTRPTGSDLFWVVDEALKAAYKAIDEGSDPADAIVRCVQEFMRRGDEVARKCGRNAAKLLEDGETILTHCYPGPALVYMLLEARSQGKEVRVMATETRPYLQGARLTAYTLREMGVPVTIICDNMVAYCMWRGLVDKYVTAADRIALDGSVANKIGTYLYAIAAHRHGIPYYVLGYGGPDPNTPTWRDIPIEERDPEEIFYLRGVRTAPEGISAYYPAFDIVPPKLISAIITDRGIFPPAAMKYYWRRG